MKITKLISLLLWLRRENRLLENTCRQLGRENNDLRLQVEMLRPKQPAPLPKMFDKIGIERLEAVNG